LTERKAKRLELSEGRVLAPEAGVEDGRLGVTESGSVAAKTVVYSKARGKTRDKLLREEGNYLRDGMAVFYRRAGQDMEDKGNR